MKGITPLREDIIDAVFRPVIAFFVGMALGYTAQLASDTGWPFAIGFAAVLAVLALVSIWMYERLYRISDWFFEKTGLGAAPRTQLATPPKRCKHWFVRFGWIIGLTTGVLAVFVLPKEVLAWL